MLEMELEGREESSWFLRGDLLGRVSKTNFVVILV